MGNRIAEVAVQIKEVDESINLAKWQTMALVNKIEATKAVQADRSPEKCALARIEHKSMLAKLEDKVEGLMDEKDKLMDEMMNGSQL